MVPAGAERRFRIPAHPSQLQRITINETAFFMHVPPGGAVSLIDDPCTGWTLEANWLDPNAAGPEHAYCTSIETDCKAGFTDGTWPRLAEEPLCKAKNGFNDDLKRCVRAPRIRFRGLVGTDLELRLESNSGDLKRLHRLPLREATTRWYNLPVSRCGFPVVRIGDQTFGLAIGIGARWTLTMDASGAMRGMQE